MTAHPTGSDAHPTRRAALVRSQADRNRLLGHPSRLTIMQALADGPRLITELTEVTGLHRNTVRAHLGRLEGAGLVETQRRPPIGPGRPAVRYRLRDELLPSGAEQQLLIGALLQLVDKAYANGAETLATAEGERIGRQLGTRLPHPTAERAVRQVTRVLRRLSFSPQITEHDDISEIALHSCPFEVAPGDPRGAIICAFHLGLIRGVVAVSGPSGRQTVRLLPHVDAELCRAEVSFS